METTMSGSIERRASLWLERNGHISSPHPGYTSFPAFGQNAWDERHGKSYPNCARASGTEGRLPRESSSISTSAGRSTVTSVSVLLNPPRLILCSLVGLLVLRGSEGRVVDTCLADNDEAVVEERLDLLSERRGRDKGRGGSAPAALIGSRPFTF